MTNNTSNNSFDIPKEGYVAFDAMSLRQLIIQRLNTQNVFTDQNFIGSNLAAIIDIIAYSYHTLIYYLNRTSTESMFSEALLYENINRIVKLLDYKPIGYQTSTLTFTCSANNFPIGLYTIPRYTYLVINGLSFSFNEDITFSKTEDGVFENLTELAEQKLLYQGRYQEYPLYTAAGDDNEIIILDVGNDTFVDHFNIDVYVKSGLTNTWRLYTKTANLYLEDGFSEKYEIRLNSNKRYEIKFGNDINGKKLQTNDQVAIYYIASNGSAGQIGPSVLNLTTPLVLYNTPQYNEILTDVNKNDYRYITTQETSNLLFNNDSSSTFFQDIEDTDQIRANAPTVYRGQYRLVTTEDYEVFIKTNFANLISDIKVVNNWDYVSGYLKYFYDIGLTNPATTERALFNQVQYSDSCNFNNIYILTVPKNSGINSLNYLLPAQKEVINSSLIPTKMATTETTFLDPVYKGVGFGVQLSLSETLNAQEVINTTTFNVYKKTSSRRDSLAIKKDIANLFLNYFSKQSMKLGQTLDIQFLTQAILGIEGVDYFTTSRRVETEVEELEGTQNVTAQGLSFIAWNPVYPNNDVQIVRNNLSTRYFEYYYFENLANIENKINVITQNINSTTVEY
jgi:hypothetical protein